MARVSTSVLIAALVVAAACLDDNAATNPLPLPAQDSLSLQLVAQGLSNPVYVTAPPADSTRVFVVEQTGRVRIVRNDTLLARAFLDLQTQVSNGAEQGLFSIAFHPDYAQNGYVFVSYTNTAGDTRIVRYSVSPDPDSLDAASGDTILQVDQPFDNHNGGLVAFGPDDYLYIGLGDGGGAGDTQGNAQSLGTLLGKLLRVDVDAAQPYGIPPGNPFVGQAGVRQEIWSYGLRNPWRFSFDRAQGDLYIGDVGQNAREEVSYQPATSAGGENYGWSVMEGLQCFGGGACDRTGLILPLLDYPNPQDGCSVTGGYVYRGPAIPEQHGTYFYADYCRGWIRSFRLVGGQVTTHLDWSTRLAAGGPISSFGEDAAGELYVAVRSGRVYRVVK